MRIIERRTFTFVLINLQMLQWRTFESSYCCHRTQIIWLASIYWVIWHYVYVFPCWWWYYLSPANRLRDFIIIIGPHAGMSKKCGSTRNDMATVMKKTFQCEPKAIGVSLKMEIQTLLWTKTAARKLGLSETLGGVSRSNT